MGPVYMRAEKKKRDMDPVCTKVEKGDIGPVRTGVEKKRHKSRLKKSFKKVDMDPVFTRVGKRGYRSGL